MKREIDWDHVSECVEVGALTIMFIMFLPICLLLAPLYLFGLFVKGCEKLWEKY